MELRHLRYYIRAAELMNFTKAAESLYVSQPTLSVQIHQLEQELGTELFARVGRNVRLTESGKLFLVRARQAVKELEEGGKEIDALRGILRGNICVASLPLYGSLMMPGWVDSFTAQHPGVHITVKAAPSEDLEAGILNGSIDLALSFLPAQHADINSRELFEDEIVIVVSKDHAIARLTSVAISDFQTVPMALPSEKISATKMLGRYFEEQGIEPDMVVRFDDGHALIELVKKGRFVTFLPRWTIQNHPDICHFALPAPGMKISNGALWINLSAAAQAFLELMTEQTKESVQRSPW